MDALERATTYLQAVCIEEQDMGADGVAPLLYAFKSGERWHVVSENTLRTFGEECLGVIEGGSNEREVFLMKGYDLQTWRTNNNAVEMPDWWTPDRQEALRAYFPGDGSRTEIAGEPIRDPAMARFHGASVVEHIVADFETGEEIATPLESPRPKMRL